jgi:RND superfamily putative drug exporter
MGTMSTLLYRLGHFAVRRRRLVLAAWLLALVVVGVLGSTVGGETSDKFEIPGTESQRALDLLDARFPAQGGSSARVVFASADGSSLADGTARTAVDDVLAAIGAQADVVDVSDPFTAGAVSPEGTIAYADVHYATSASEVSEEAKTELLSVTSIGESAGVQVEFGGDVTADRGAEGHSSELIGLAVAVVVLLISFGSVIAMGLPLITALLGVGIALTGITLIAGFTDLSSTAPTLATMIGLAVGIDYALFIVTRHRQNLSEGFEVAEAAARANATAGGAVVFAGITVVIALAGLSVVGIPFITVMGLAAAFTVLIAIMIAVTLIPALLGFAGHNIDKFKIGRAQTGAHDEASPTLSARWAKRVTARPGIALAAGLVVMLVLAAPTLSMRLGSPDAGSNAKSSTSRQAYDLLASGFGPGFNGPLTVVADLDGAADPTAALDALSSAIAADSDVLTVNPAGVNEAGNTAVIQVVPRSGPASEQTEELVHRLRSDVVPSVEQSTGVDVALTGSTAVNIDISDKLGKALPVFIILVIGLTLLLLMIVFRSLIVPIKAAIAILLSIASSFGVLVAIFQWGWLSGLVGLEETIPIISFLPIIMFAILFGLSMDYEVFIMSRVREDYVRTGQARGSVLSGLTSSARVITAAALIMISVFGSFVLGDDPTIKMFGIGLSAAVFLDATVVRMMLVPAVMALLDRKAWYLPTWLDRLLPDLDVEGEHLIERLNSGTPHVDDRELVDAAH